MGDCQWSRCLSMTLGLLIVDGLAGWKRQMSHKSCWTPLFHRMIQPICCILPLHVQAPVRLCSQECCNMDLWIAVSCDLWLFGEIYRGLESGFCLQHPINITTNLEPISDVHSRKQPYQPSSNCESNQTSIIVQSQRLKGKSWEILQETSKGLTHSNQNPNPCQP